MLILVTQNGDLMLDKGYRFAAGMGYGEIHDHFRVPREKSVLAFKYSKVLCSAIDVVPDFSTFPALIIRCSPHKPTRQVR